MQLVTNNSLEEQKSHGTYAFPILLSYEALSKYDSFSFIPHWHSEIELTLITSGDMLYSICNHTIHAKEGDIIFCNSGSLHSGRQFSNNDCSYTSLTINPCILYGYKGSQLYEKYIKHVIQDITCPYMFFPKDTHQNNNIMSNIKSIEKLYFSKDPLYELEIIICLLNIWKDIYANIENSRLSHNITNDILSRIRKILNYIEENYNHKISLRDIANEINLCESECSRLFKKAMQKSLFEFIVEYRIKKAATILKATDEPIGQIAEKVGFNDSNNFSRTFHKIIGLSPSEYRKLLKKTDYIN
ncbi:AraC family transcriptional regulator [Pseudobutyrivibrio sp.]|jgi:AraC-like DNA-binding protein|uniref:AraC family transcriptional regulator n=1 Tax=Pseudobutyrivibrio sp. TaxID=2014367 RepID=UPI0025D26EAD|nr:AraC family transcriptional regulator [Pseudobutyrivibrio sp.]